MSDDNRNDYNLPAEYPERLLTPILNQNLALDCALGVDTDTILEAYNLQHHELEAVKNTTIFKATLRKVEEELAQHGASFKIKAQAQAEVLLAESFKMAMNEDISSTVRSELIKQNVRWAGFDNPAPEGGKADNGFTININLGGSGTVDQARVVNSETHSAE